MIDLKGLSFWYPDEKDAVLKDVTLHFGEGEIVLLAGPNGGGKSTLLKAILGVVPKLLGGTLTGEITYQGRLISELETSQLAGKIGIVLQDPESQISNMTVQDEVEFGPANLCWSKNEIDSQVDSALVMMGIDHLRKVSVLALSGGQMQRLSLASLLAMQPEVLILDEPITNLDPLGVASVIEAIKIMKGHVKLMLISSHWLDPFIEFTTRVVIMERGEVVLDVNPEDLHVRSHELTKFGVEIPQLWQLEAVLLAQGFSGSFLFDHRWQLREQFSQERFSPKTLVSVKDVSFQYGRDGAKPLRDISLTIGSGERLAIVGHNGQGKTTLVRIIAGFLKPTSGRIQSTPRSVSMMLQKPTLGFLCNTVLEELSFGSKETAAQISKMLDRFDLSKYSARSPFQLSGGEQRRLSLAIALANSPDLLILDESTAGLDANQVATFLSVLETFRGTVIQITHDSRVVGGNVDTVAVLGGGKILFQGMPSQLSGQTMLFLGYEKVNPVVEFGMQWLDAGIPMLADQVEVQYVGI